LAKHKFPPLMRPRGRNGGRFVFGGSGAESNCRTAWTAARFAGDEMMLDTRSTSADTDTPTTEDVGRAPAPAPGPGRNSSAHDFFTGAGLGAAVAAFVGSVDEVTDPAGAAVGVGVSGSFGTGSADVWVITAGKGAEVAEGVPLITFGEIERDVFVEMGECGVRVSAAMLVAGVVSATLVSP
jgi:hypothetical protein